MKKNRVIKRLIILSIVAVGISSISNQILIIREFLSQFQGNEITISAVIFFWLLIGGSGSLLSKYFKKESLLFLSILLFLSAILPLAQIILIRLLRNLFFIPGSSVGLSSIIFYILCTTFFYCFIIGFILPYSQKALKEIGYTLDTGRLYLIDNIGDITGGAITSFVLIYLLKPFPIIAVTSFPIILISLYLLYLRRRWLIFCLFLFLSILFFYVSLSPSIEIKSLVPHYGNILRYVESPYGRIVVTREDSQYTIWDLGKPFYFQKNIEEAEEKVHYTLCQLDHIRDVLLISGGIGRTIKEIEKYHPHHIDYVELDPIITKIGSELGLIPKKADLSIINQDGRYYLKNTKKRYSAIIVDLPDPDTFQINRFFTREFFLLAKRHLEKGGVISISMDYSPNYMSLIRKKKISILYNTLRSCFKYIGLIPGKRLYFISGDRPIYMDIPEILFKKHIKTLYAAPYFYGNATPDRIGYIKEAVLQDKRINTDLKPCLVSVLFYEWFRKFQIKPSYFLFPFFAIMILYLLFIKREEYVLFSTGLSLMGIEMLTIFLFQIAYGYVYLKVGAIITMFLLGLFPGSMVGIRFKGDAKKYVSILEILILCMIAISCLGANVLNKLPKLLFFIYPLVFSFLCGFQFPKLAEIIGEESSAASLLFAADLIGASLGTILIGIITIPFFGILDAVFLIASLKIISIIVWSRIF